ncbi:neutral/alkaline non-lysosomal ceramidase N-terminal domain-containing protein [Thermoflexibacter ruber]|uniref:Neutral/alkaline non-lysosomal ceramidase, N-terminal n=1 Tax=Thermoflexibacter ruber TaxID=1003 RepID=A0A1I2GAE3_9BACT|nr:neutral/alkaline non-lysosomal ceramidase N-terminal domain-containing protein [Thermoflexibacter ruber]SFF13950.1 Neutral/alkaline non-lysosomal ceramidase, N-terminal [Thermoflexibacter ruber]
MQKKFIKLLFRFFITVALLSVLLALVLFTTASEDAYQESNYYKETIKQLSQIQFDTVQNTNTVFKAGWARRSITPEKLAPLAGYGIARGKTQAIHDSLFVSAVVLESNAKQVVILSYDLLIAPPLIVNRLAGELAQLGLKREHIFFTATHTHHGVGGWAKGVAGWLIAGGYDAQITENIVKQTFLAIQEAQHHLLPARIGFGKVNAPEFVKSRLHEHQERLDTWVRYLKIQQSSGKTACLLSYSAHATCTDGLLEVFSRDYAGAVVDSLEKNTQTSIDLAVFSAGTVASHTPMDFGLHNEAWIGKMGQGLAEKLLNQFDSVLLKDTVPLSVQQLPVEFGATNVRVSDNIKLADWAFKFLYPEHHIYIAILQIGDILWLGMPCDFSGEFMSIVEKTALQKNKKLIITSFNGSYMGYLTPDEYYNLPHYETREMNWLGKKGSYFIELIEKIIAR